MRLYGSRLGLAKRLACQARILMGLTERLLMESRRGNFCACKLAARCDRCLPRRMGKRVAPGATGL